MRVHHSNKELHSVCLKVVGPKANPKSFLYNFALVGAILHLFYTIFFYDINDDVTLHECEPFYGQQRNFHDF
jgi:hypothetical protein